MNGVSCKDDEVVLVDSSVTEALTELNTSDFFAGHYVKILEDNIQPCCLDDMCFYRQFTYRVAEAPGLNRKVVLRVCDKTYHCFLEGWMFSRNQWTWEKVYDGFVAQMFSLSEWSKHAQDIPWLKARTDSSILFVMEYIENLFSDNL